jgi:uncharacterized protein (DUF433 family)
MELPAFLTEDQYGEIHLTGHRIPLYTIVRLQREGLSPEQIAQELPTISLDQVQEVLSFCQAKRAEVDGYADAVRDEIERQANAPPGPGILRIRRLLQMVEEADEKHRGDASWQALSTIDKLRRIEQETGTSML